QRVRTDVVATPARTLDPDPGSSSQVVSARPERQGFPRSSASRTSALRASVLRGLDAGLAPTGAQLRQPGAALCSTRKDALPPERGQESLDGTAAALLQNEVTNGRTSTRNALEAHPQEDCHATCCPSTSGAGNRSCVLVPR